MAIETLDDIVEQYADRMGVYGAHGSSYCDEDQLCRCCWTSLLKDRIRQAVEIERKLSAS